MKKVLAMVLAVVMVAAMLPTMAFAAEPIEITEVNITIETDFDAKTFKATPAVDEAERYDDDGGDAVNIRLYDKAETLVYAYVNAGEDVAWFECEESESEDSEDAKIIEEKDVDMGKVDFAVWEYILVTADSDEYQYGESLTVNVNGVPFNKISRNENGAYTSTGYVREDDEYLHFYIRQDLSTAPSGKANIKGVIDAADFAYELVIPSDTLLTEDDHEDVLLGDDGIVTIEVTKHGAKNVDVFYTVDLDGATLTDGETEITTTYGFSETGEDDSFDTLAEETEYTVYTGGAVKNTYVNVSADNDEWDAAPVGEYTAVVVFNFDQKEIAAVTIGDIFPEDLRLASMDDNYFDECYNEGTWEGFFAAAVIEENSAFDEFMKGEEYEIAGEFAIILPADGGVVYSVPLTTALTPIDGGYKYVGHSDNFGMEGTGDVVTVFSMDGDDLAKISITVLYDEDDDLEDEVATVDLMIGAAE